MRTKKQLLTGALVSVLFGCASHQQTTTSTPSSSETSDASSGSSPGVRIVKSRDGSFGMGKRQVEDLIGRPDDFEFHGTGKGFIPFYFGGELTCPSTGYAGTFRPFAFTAPITTTARVKEQHGFGTLLRRYVTRFVVRNNGTLNQGYGVVVGRSDDNFDNSTVILVEDNTQLAILPSTFQYGPEIHMSVTFNLDGNITGTVSEPAPSTNTFSFSFGPHAIQSTGDNFSIAVECSSGPARLYGATRFLSPDTLSSLHDVDSTSFSLDHKLFREGGSECTKPEAASDPSCLPRMGHLLGLRAFGYRNGALDNISIKVVRPTIPEPLELVPR